MAIHGLDPVDKGIIYLLQENARSNTTTSIGESVGVSSSTVANRIQKLESQGVITGYHPTVDYEKAGLEHHFVVVGTVPFDEQAAIVDDIMSVAGVVSVRELLSNRGNVSIELVEHTREKLEESLRELDRLGVDIERFEILKRERTRPYNHFGQKFIDGESD
ncbi:Lrp/AsnC family transcriptional regulator [Haloarcula onubensis]|uniref:Lrp/AsnC family transcriptional regulator n=1 Tax=Haloarcula onubensis TaxID=2950539 RepID=A0ABU2FL09_9EURY|nr:winged helix-turn-helix transcriptional regulator [Halomicroarcula sp. S3CR25-11]MDS0281444.1 Lrp/AsnC family transcriptional regulator [Halomicroarcula sp. S3CR25-11]